MGSDPSLRSALRLFQFCEKELEEIAADVLPGSASLDEPLGTFSATVLIRLLHSKVLEDLWRERSAIAYRNATGYLRQEHVTADGHVGVVDIGWLGKASGSLVEIVEADAPGKQVTCYFTGGLVGAGSDSAPTPSRALHG